MNAPLCACISAGVSIAAPVSIVRDEDGNTFFTVVPNNPTGVTFQWFRGDTAIRRIDQYYNDIDTDSLRIFLADNSFNGEYRVQMSRRNYFCTSDSPTVTLSAREYIYLIQTR